MTPPPAAACDACEASLPRDASYCLSCGRPQREDEFTRCPACESPNVSGSRFCSGCGEFLASVAEAERRIVTVLFADLAGFTPATEQLDPEAVREIITGVFEPLGECVTRWGGFVDKFIGDCVMALFGAPVALENEAESALHAALDMREALRAWEGPGGSGAAGSGEDAGEAARIYRPELSIGVNTGQVVTGVFTGGGARDYTAVGDVVNVAARLQSLCEPGRILVGRETVAQAHHAFEFGQEESFSVAGREESVRARHLEGRRSERRSWRGFGESPMPLVGRTAELEELRGHWRRAHRSGMHSCLILGAPGIGKSRLVEELVEREGIERSRVGRGRSYPYAAATPWETVGEMVRSLFGLPAEAPGDEARAAVLGGAPESWTPEERVALGIALGAEDATGSALGGLAPEERRDRVVSATLRALEIGSGGEPVLLVGEDLHWTDRASLGFFRQLQGRSAPFPGLALLVTRPPLPDQQRLDELIEGARTRLELAPLSPEESRELAEGTLGAHELPEGLIEEVLGQASGNPLFIEEALKTLRDRGILRREGGVWRASRETAELGLPDSVESVLSSRIDGLHPPAKRVLQYASIVGRRFWSGVLSEALAGRTVDQELAELREGEFVHRRRQSSIPGEREFAFQHLLLQEVAYRGLLRRSRQEHHGAVAAWLEERLPDDTTDFADWIAYHYERSTDPSRAVPHLQRAARAARDQGALDDAAALIRRAADASDDATESRRLLCTLEEIAADLGDADVRRRAVAEIDGLSDGQPEGEAEAAYRWTRYLIDRGELDDAEAAGRKALELYRDLERVSREADVLAMLGRIAHLRGDYSEALDRYRASRPLQRETGDRRGEAEVTDRLGLVEVDWGRFVRAQERFEEARRIYAELGDTATEARIRAHRATALRWLASLEDAELVAREALAMARESGSRRSWASVALTLATILGDRGHRTEAEDLLEEVVEFAEGSGREALLARAWLAFADITTGASGRECVDRALAAGRESGLAHVGILARTREAELALTAGEIQRADRASAEAVERLQRQGHVQGPEERVLWTRAKVLTGLGRATEASRFRGEARAALQEKLDWIEGEEPRDRFLDGRPLNTEILASDPGHPDGTEGAR